MIKKVRWINALSVVCLLCAGCTAMPDTHSAVDQGDNLEPPEERSTEWLGPAEGYSPNLVAILPFVNLLFNDNQEEKAEQAEIVRKTFANHFSSRGYQTQWGNTTDSLLHEGGFDKPEDIAKLPLETLRDITHADAVIFGQLTHFDRIFLGVYAQTAVGAKLRMVDVKSGKTMWEAEKVSREHSGGFSIEPIGIVLTLVENALAMRQVEVLGAAEDLFREMVTSIPLANIGQVASRPTITLLVNESFNQTLKSGETIRVALTGDPGLAASFDLGEYRTNVSMNEIEPGVYLGTYPVSPGDNVENLVVKGNLIDDRSGEKTTWIDALGPITLDTSSPSTPAGLFASAKNEGITVTWREGKEPDLAKYNVYRSLTPLSGYDVITTTESPKFADTYAIKFQTYYYKIAAVDKAGNESALSGRVRGTPVPPGPTRISGHLTQDAHWYAGASPYIIEQDIEIGQGTTLTIEPGSEIQSMGGAMVVRGRLLAEGEPENWITFTSSPAKPNGQWEGLIFWQTGNVPSTLQNVRVTKAQVGITCTEASPILTHVEISNNEIGLAIRAPSSRPNVTHSTISQNHKHGILIEEHAQPIVTHNRITQNQDHGIVIRNAPLATISGNQIVENAQVQLSYHGQSEILDVSGNWWGTTNIPEVLSQISGKLQLATILGSADPEAEEIALSSLQSPLGGVVSTSTLLLEAHSPYLLAEPLVIDNEATLTIQAGVVVMIKSGMNAIVLKKGALQVLGKPDQPVLFTSANSSPRPGDYKSAIQFEGEGSQPSRLEFVKIQYAETGILVNAGAPEIHHADISLNLQSAVKCSGQSAPSLSYSTFTHHENNGAIVSLGQSRPVLFHNNFIDNAWGVINHSSLPLEARENWWGTPNPHVDLFIGNVVYQPHLLTPEAKGFSYAGRKSGNAS